MKGFFGNPQDSGINVDVKLVCVSRGKPALGCYSAVTQEEPDDIGLSAIEGVATIQPEDWDEDPDPAEVSGMQGEVGEERGDGDEDLYIISTDELTWILGDESVCQARLEGRDYWELQDQWVDPEYLYTE